MIKNEIEEIIEEFNGDLFIEKIGENNYLACYELKDIYHLLTVLKLLSMDNDNDDVLTLTKVNENGDFRPIYYFTTSLNAIINREPQPERTRYEIERIINKYETEEGIKFYSPGLCFNPTTLCCYTKNDIPILKKILRELGIPTTDMTYSIDTMGQTYIYYFENSGLKITFED